MINKSPITENEKLEFLEKSIQSLFNQNIKLNLSDNLHDLGIDSLDVVELQLNYEETFNCQLPDTHSPIIYVSDIIKLMP
jgi:acyl carrier protein